MEAVVAADARVLEHLAVEGQARRRAAGRAAAGQRRGDDDGRAKVDDGAADSSGQRTNAGKQKSKGPAVVNKDGGEGCK